MIWHRCKWVWNASLNLYKHSIQTSYKEPWRELDIASDETVYWQGRPQRVFLRWSMLIFPTIGLALIWVACSKLTFSPVMRTMSIIVAGGGIFCLICAFLNFLNLSYTTYLLTDRRVCIDNTLFHIRHEYDLPSYLKDFYGDFAFRQTWQPSNL